LWQADLADQNVLMRGRIDAGAWKDASLRWLVDPVSPPEADLPGGVRVGMGDVERFRVTVEAFGQLDDRFGGGHGRQALIQYLSSDGGRLLRGRFAEAVGSALFSSVAEATLLAAWMSYDSAPRSALAQRYFIQALALAQAGGDRLLGASILDAMSHQATFTGRFGEAASLARAARTGTAGIATPTLTAHFLTMEARALARLGDARGCDRALAAAARARPGSPVQRTLAAAFAASAHRGDQLDLLTAWLDGNQAPGGLAVDAELRARALFTLSARGRARQADVDALPELDHANGARYRATCLAMRPDPHDREEAWRAVISGTVTGRLAEATAQGVWVAGQEQLMAGYRSRYFGEAPARARRDEQLGAATARTAAVPLDAVRCRHRGSSPGRAGQQDLA
jgi:hypothetical protein